ncbi:MAG TPA: hypothetical protein VFC19_53545 [Candidatus Limnocylindrales bacterium]|nr:hypothetical protein [Candidatus Limnocylindrales bacterium]
MDKVRAMAKAIDTAVGAARARDADGLRGTAADLSKLDAEQTGKVMGGVLRLLLERKHPDGLDGDDIRDLLQSCALGATTWLPETDPHTMLVVLAGALGIHPDEHEQVARPTAESIALNTSVLIAFLLKGRLEPYLTATFDEIARSEFMD